MLEEKIGKIRKNIIYNTIGTVIYLFSQWIMTIIIVKISGFDSAGNLALAITSTTTFSTISLYGMRQFQVSDYRGKYTDKIYISSRIFTCMLSMISLGIYILLNNYTINQKITIIIYMIFKISEAIIDVYHGIDQKAWRFDIICNSYIIRGLGTLITFTLIICITNNLSLSIIGIIIVTIIEIIIYDIPKTNKLKENKSREINIKKIKELLIECLPLVLVLFASTIYNLIPRNNLLLKYGEETLGIYASIATPTLIIQVLASVIYNPIIPIFAKYDNENNKNEYKKLLIKSTMIIVIFAFIAIVGTRFWGNRILLLLFGASILPYTGLLISVVWCTILTAFSWLLIGILTATRKIKEVLYSSIIGTIVCIAINKEMINKYKSDGVSYTIIISISIQIIIMIIIIIRQMKKNSNEVKND